MAIIQERSWTPVLKNQAEELFTIQHSEWQWHQGLVSASVVLVIHMHDRPHYDKMDKYGTYSLGMMTYIVDSLTR